VLGLASRVDAAYFNLTTAGATATIDGAIFTQGVLLSGTGNFPAFVQITGSDPVHDAYNTTANNTLDNGSSPTFNHEILLSAVGEVNCGTIAVPVTCYEFLLDINESNGQGGGPNAGTDADKYLSLDLLQIYTSNTPNQSTSDPSTLGTLEYTMGTDNHIGLDFNISAGSGKADMSVWIPKSLFPAEGPNVYVYLYSLFGALGSVGVGGAGTLPAGNYGASDGFEEWALGLNPTQQCTDPNGCEQLVTPEPASIALMGTGLTAIALRLRRRRAAKRGETV
jgi:hypothetical protein